jgi:hypothetical protein
MAGEVGLSSRIGDSHEQTGFLEEDISAVCNGEYSSDDEHDKDFEGDAKPKGEEDTMNVASLRKLRNQTISGDIKASIYEARFTAPLVAAFAALLVYQITVAPYQSNKNRWQDQTAADSRPFSLIRPNLTDHEMLYIQRVGMNAETAFVLPSPSYDTVKLRFQSSVSSQGTVSPPDIFFKGVTFGITSQNPYSLEYTGQLDFASDDLYADLLNMHPRPTSVMERRAVYNQTQWSEAGFAVYFSYSDLMKNGKLSSDKLQPWKRVADDVIQIARDYKQVYVTVWYPHSFGRQRATNPTYVGQQDPEISAALYAARDDATSPRTFEVILQEILPTRTGLNGIKSSSVVWLSAINGSATVTAPPIYQRQ